VTLTPLGAGTALPAPAPDAAERYGAGSSFDRIANLEDPSLLLDLQDAMDRIDLPPGARVLELGCGRGDLARWWCARRPDVAYLGLDHARSAIELATTGAPPGAHFEVRDVTALDGLGRFDLVIAIAVLQSRDLDDRALVQRLVTAHLAPRGAVLLGIPNHRWRDGELRPGARQKNYRQPELGPLVRDLAYYRRYLQQKRRRVFITGRHTLLVTAIVDGVDTAATA
jgi:trans-aconitate methyltransferase